MQFRVVDFPSGFPIKVITSGGKLPARTYIHFAHTNQLWIASCFNQFFRIYEHSVATQKREIVMETKIIRIIECCYKCARTVEVVEKRTRQRATQNYDKIKHSLILQLSSPSTETYHRRQANVCRNKITMFPILPQKLNGQRRTE